MSPVLPREERDAIRARVEAATPGPWTALTTGRAGGDHWYVCDEDESIALISANDGINEDQREPDAEFIAHARTDVPALLDALDAAEAEVAALRGRIEAATGLPLTDDDMQSIGETTVDFGSLMEHAYGLAMSRVRTALAADEGERTGR